MEANLKEIEIYLTEKGKAPFSDWLESLSDIRARAKIRMRLDRLRLGNFGDSKSVGDGVFELRVDFGPGYRVYYGLVGVQIVLLLCGGDKSSQKKDIRLAKNYWKNFVGNDEKKNKKIPR